MFSSLAPLFIIGILMVILGAWQRNDRKILSLKMAMVWLPGLMLMTLYWSFVIHMKMALDGWPLGIGEVELEGNKLLSRHAGIALNFMGFNIIGFFACFGLMLALVFIKKHRPYLFYLGGYAAGITLAIALMFLAPQGFQHWWWD